jgi:predicted amidophosphoribosyltransferase
MAELAGESFRGFLQAVERPVVTWVPAHGASMRSRGYNQSEVLARHLAREAGGVPVIPLVRKVTRTRHQKALGREQRRQNLRGAFSPLPGSCRRAAGQAGGGPFASVGPSAEGVVMVDDVYTTGATAQEVADVIGRSTGLPVHVFTFCRTIAAGDGSIA